MSLRQHEIDQNYQYFQSVVGSYIGTHEGQYAVLHHRSVVGIYRSLAEAVNVGHAQFDGGVFSIQEVTDSPIDMGFYSHAAADGSLHKA